MGIRRLYTNDKISALLKASLCPQRVNSWLLSSVMSLENQSILETIMEQANPFSFEVIDDCGKFWKFPR